MAIRLSCACGRNYSLKDSVAGKSFDCKQCGATLSIPAVPDTEEQDVSSDLAAEAVAAQFTTDEWDGKSNRRRRKQSRRQQPTSREKRPPGQRVTSSVLEITSVLTTAYSEASPKRKIAMLVLPMMAVGFVGFVTWTFFLTAAVSLLLVPLSLLCSPPLMFLLTDAYYRWWIRTEIESLGGTIKKIVWRPFQGALFTRGWKLGRGCRFYQVTFTNRRGREQVELCGISFLRGAAWGDDLDEMQFATILDARLETWAAWGAITLAVALTTFFALNESAYAVLGQQHTATVTANETREVRRHRGGRHWTEKQTIARYEWTDAAGIHHGRTSFTGTGPQTLQVETLPLGGGHRLLGTTVGQLWLKACAYLALFFGLLYGLDYFDVFGVHAATRRRASP